MSHILTRKLEGFAALSEADRRAIDNLAGATQRLPAGRDLIREGDRPERVFLLVEGWACRYKTLLDGRRQIMAFLIPGDLCDIHIFVLKAMDHSIAMLSDAVVLGIEPNVLLALMDAHPAVERALWWATLVDEAVLREWLVNMGQRDAYTSIAHLLYEMWLRVRAVGLADGDQFSLPLTQVQLGDTMGLTPVAVNRALQRLRQEGLITLDQRRLTIHGPEQLAAVSGFQSRYLHLNSENSATPPILAH